MHPHECGVTFIELVFVWILFYESRNFNRPFLFLASFSHFLHSLTIYKLISALPSQFHRRHSIFYMKYSKPYEKNICLFNISYKISNYQWNGRCRPAANPCVNQGKKVFHFSSFEFLPGLPMSFYCPRVDFPDLF